MTPTQVDTGQTWSVWEPGRHQWLLATVTGTTGKIATLQFDSRYKIGSGYETRVADESDMLGAPRLFRFVEPLPGSP